MRGALLFLAVLCANAAAQIQTGKFPMASVVTPDNKYLLVMNAGDPPAIAVIDLASSKELSRTPVPDAWLGLELTKAGDKLYVGGASRNAVFEFTFAGGALTKGRTFALPQDFVGDVRLAPDGHLLYVASLYKDTVVVMNPQSGAVLSRIKTGRRPYRILFHPSGRSFYVSSWADGAVGQYDTSSGAKLANFRIAPHPTDLLWVDGTPARMFVAASNTNNVYALTASETGDLTPLQTISLALTQRQPLGMTPSALALSTDRKTVYAACSDGNTVAVIDIGGELIRVAGFLPTGKYPTALNTLAEARLAVLNGHGDSVQILKVPEESELLKLTGEVIANSPYSDDRLDAPVTSPAQIRHIFYVVRGGDAEALSWATAAIGTDYIVRLGKYGEPAAEPANQPPAGYIWNAVLQAGLKVRNYGFMVHNREKPTADGEQIDRVYDPALAQSTDMEYRGPDPAYSDVDRAKEFASEIADYDQVGDMPQLLLIRIGTTDEALKLVTDAIQKSKYSKESVMLTVEGGHATSAASALRTIEAALHLKPLTMFDAAARPTF